jgi:hypothetical protein
MQKQISLPKFIGRFIPALLTLTLTLCFLSLQYIQPGQTAFALTLDPQTQSYGPPNLFKIMPTPFSPGEATFDPDSYFKKDADESSDNHEAGEGPFKSPFAGSRHIRGSLNQRLNIKQKLVASRLFLPGGMQLGQLVEFTVQGKTNSYVALAMADKDSGAKPIYGQELHLGPDRKVIAIGKIPESGVLKFTIETPVQGDLIGLYLYFEAAIWKAKDFSDLELAKPENSLVNKGPANGVLITAEAEKKKGVKFVPAPSTPFYNKIDSAF